MKILKKNEKNKIEVPPYKSDVYGVWLLWRLGWYLLAMYLALAFINHLDKKHYSMLDRTLKV